MLAVYATAADVTKQVDLYKGIGLSMLVGPNWTVTVPEDDRGTMQTVQAVLGGKIVDPGEADADVDPKPEPEPEMAGVGDKVRDDDYQFTVTKVRCGVSRVGSEWLGEKAQGQFCLVSMRVKNVGDAPINYSSENQTLVDRKGRDYSPDDEAWIYLDDSDVFGEINPGNTLKTTVPFDIPKKAKPDYLLLKAGVWGFSEGVRVNL
jgi:hypothetical protein